MNLLLQRAALSRLLGSATVIACLATAAMPVTRAAAHTAARPARSSEIDYPLYDRDPMRSGVNAAETRITTASAGHLTRKWRVQLAGIVDSSAIELAGAGPKSAPDLLYVTTQRGLTYALNAHTGATVWLFNPHTDTLPSYRITAATPAADPSRQWIYAASPDGKIHRLSATTGSEASGWPIAVTLHPEDEKIASALNIVGHTLLVTTSGYIGDRGHYDGHVLAIDTQTRQMRIFNSLCSDLHTLLAESPGGGSYCAGAQSGIWARGGAVVDQVSGSPTAGSIFVVTGNGPYDGKINWGDSILRLQSNSLRLQDAYTPTNQQDLNDQDLDLGSTTPILLPRQPGNHAWLAVQGGKDNVLRLVDRTNLSGRGGPGHISGELQTVPIPQGSQMVTSGIAWQDGKNGTWVFVATYNGLAAERVVVTDGLPTLHVAWIQRAYFSSPILAGGVLFAAQPNDLDVFNPRTGAILWHSAASAAHGRIGDVHWESPMVVNGMAYMPDQNGALTAYGLP